jgi:hypothetical protein
MAKTLNALIYPSAPGVIVERRMIDVATIPPHKASWWRPVVEAGNDPIDPATQIKTGPVTTIEATRVLDTYTIRNKTAQELDDDKAARIDSMNGQQALIKVLHNLHNRIRTLEGQSTHTLAQFKNAIKSLL